MQCWLDHLSGVDFASSMSNAETGIPADKGVLYQATTPRIYLALWRRLRKVSDSDAVIDVGCGKGRMLKYFSRFSFGRVDGLEYSEVLGEIARRNMERLNLKCEIYIHDAAKFNGYCAYNYFYLFNPFPEGVLREFLNRLKESVIECPSHAKLTIFYMNCPYIEVLKEEGFSMISLGKGIERGLAVFEYKKEV